MFFLLGERLKCPKQSTCGKKWPLHFYTNVFNKERTEKHKDQASTIDVLQCVSFNAAVTENSSSAIGRAYGKGSVNALFDDGSTVSVTEEYYSWARW